MSPQSINPATGQVLERFEETSAPELERILKATHEAFLYGAGLILRGRSAHRRSTDRRGDADGQ